MTLCQAIHGAFRRLHYSPRTEEAYLHWIWAFIAYRLRAAGCEIGVRVDRSAGAVLVLYVYVR